MARVLRVHWSGAIYHAMARGNGRQAIFRNDRDRERFLENLEQCVQAHAVRLYLFVLMPNHFHLLLETPHANISVFMQSLLTGYTGYFNRKHETVGHLFQGRFKGKVVQGDEYLLRLSRYIHLNPIASGSNRSIKQDGVTVAGYVSLRERMRRLRAYRWSTFPEYAGLAPLRSFVEHGPILTMTPGVRMATKGEAPDGVTTLAAMRKAYRRFVETGLAKSDEGFQRIYEASPLAIGSEEFARETESRYEQLAKQASKAADVSFRKTLPRLSCGTVLEAVAQEFGVTVEALAGTARRREAMQTQARTVAAWLLKRYAGVSYRKAADLLGWGSGQAVSVQVRRVLAELGEDSELQESVMALEARIKGKDAGDGYQKSDGVVAEDPECGIQAGGAGEGA